MLRVPHPHPVPVTIRDNGDHIRVLLYSYYTTIAEDAPMSLLKGTQKEALSMYNIRKVPSEAGPLVLFAFSVGA